MIFLVAYFLDLDLYYLTSTGGIDLDIRARSQFPSSFMSSSCSLIVDIWSVTGSVCQTRRHICLAIPDIQSFIVCHVSPTTPTFRRVSDACDSWVRFFFNLSSRWAAIFWCAHRTHSCVSGMHGRPLCRIFHERVSGAEGQYRSD